jgi:hypothetical protein
MTKKIAFFLSAIVCFGIVSCNTEDASGTKKSLTKAVFNPDSLAIVELMRAQESAWNFGNVEGFMKPYWKSDSLQFIGKKGLTLGWQKTLDNYKQSYPDKAAMGRLDFTNLHIEILDEEAAFVVGRWQLSRIADTLSGHYTLLWKKMNNKWVIAADHSS